MNRFQSAIRRHKHRLFRLNNVIGVGYGKKEKRGRLTSEDAIIIMVRKKMPLQLLSKTDVVPKQIERCKTDVQEIGTLKLQARTGKLRPAPGGVSIGHTEITAGTLGAVVRDKRTGAPLILSNNHILANQTNGFDGRANKGDDILQPGAYDKGVVPNDVLAHLERYSPVKTDIEAASCPIAQGFERFVNNFLHSMRPDYSFKLFKQGISNTVDCAVARPVNPEDVDFSILEIGEVKGTIDPVVGMRIVKSGRTTGLTRGTIKAIDSSVEVDMGDNTTAIFEDQIVASAMSEGGDSGSLVLDENNNAVGLLFAGSDKATVCNKINNVMNALNITF